MKPNALNLPHGIGGWIQLMVFVNLDFSWTSNSSLHHHPHGLTSKMLLKLYNSGHVLIANPLMARMPRLIYGLLGTCRLKANGTLYKSFTKKYLEKGVGPLQGHVLDGNNRRQKLMLDNIYKGIYNLRIQGFLMCVTLL